MAKKNPTQHHQLIQLQFTLNYSKRPTAKIITKIMAFWSGSKEPQKFLLSNQNQAFQPVLGAKLFFQRLVVPGVVSSWKEIGEQKHHETINWREEGGQKKAPVILN